MRTVEELSAELKKIYDRERGSGQVVAIHLFGIRNAEALKTLSVPAILERAGLPPSYRTEVRKAINLAPFVSVN